MMPALSCEGLEWTILSCRCSRRLADRRTPAALSSVVSRWPRRQNHSDLKSLQPTAGADKNSTGRPDRHLDGAALMAWSSLSANGRSHHGVAVSQAVTCPPTSVSVKPGESIADYAAKNCDRGQHNHRGPGLPQLRIGERTQARCQSSADRDDQRPSGVSRTTEPVRAAIPWSHVGEHDRNDESGDHLRAGGPERGVADGVEHDRTVPARHRPRRARWRCARRVRRSTQPPEVQVRVVKSSRISTASRADKSQYRMSAPNIDPSLVFDATDRHLRDDVKVWRPSPQRCRWRVQAGQAVFAAFRRPPAS